MMKSKFNKQNSKKVILLFTIFFIIILFTFPMITNILTAFKSDADISQSPPRWIFKPVLTHFKTVLQGGGYRFTNYLVNSIIIALSSTFLAVIVTLPAAYSIVRYKGVGRIVMGGALLLRLMPMMSLAIPIFVIFHRLDLIDTRLSIIIMHTLIITPTALMLFIGYIQDLPSELEDAAAVDGANVLQMILFILIPIIRPGIAAVSILGFIMSWNEFLFAVILSVDRAVTATVGTSFFITSHQVRWGDMAAAITITSIPTLIFIFVMQQQLIKGITAGAVKQ